MTKGDGDMDQMPVSEPTEPSFLRHLVKTILTSYQFWMITTALIFGYMLGRTVH